MFEVGFTELLVIFALALIVLGPEKLPRLASQVGRWLGRARAMARQFREQLEEETILEESKTRQAANPPAAQAPATPPSAADPPQPPPEKYYQPDDDIARSDVSHADAGADPSTPATDHERGT